MESNLPGRVYSKRFETMQAFIAECPASYRTADDFNGYESMADAKRNSIEGRLSLVPQAEALLSQIETSGLIARGAPAYVNDVAGAFPNVPAFLSGHPECMFRRGDVEALSEQSPMTVYVDCCASAAISAKELQGRGIAILALVLALSERRPIDLYVFASLGESDVATVPIVRIEARPLDIAAASYALTAAAFLRQMCMGWSAPGGYRGGWAFDLTPTNVAHQRHIRTILGAEKQDLVVHAAFVGDKLHDKPLEWLKSQLAIHFSQAD